MVAGPCSGDRRLLSTGFGRRPPLHPRRTVPLLHQRKVASVADSSMLYRPRPSARAEEPVGVAVGIATFGELNPAPLADRPRADPVKMAEHRIDVEVPHLL